MTVLTALAAPLVAGGLALVVVGALGWRRRLPRNRFAGVRTVNTLRDERTFAVGNRVGAPLTVAAGSVAALGGLAVLTAPTRPVAVLLLVLSGLGMLALTVTGGVLGDRAAARVPLPSPPTCGGRCTGCGAGGGCAASPETSGPTSCPADATDPAR